MARPLVIVESPAKARTIARFLGGSYVVEASLGHVRDLPRKGLAVDVENDFKPTYEVTRKDVVRSLKAKLADADELYLATDEDREGEAIAWHLYEALKPQVPVKRMVFHEITPEAIRRARENPRDIDWGLVDAQETRRILDRLYGYEVSPVLWRKVQSGLSAGRVQSVATRLVVERERERMRFRAASYADIRADAATDPAFAATLVEVDERRVATGRDFDSSGTLTHAGILHLDLPAAEALADRLEGRSLTVRTVEEKPYRSSPRAPFITSTLQQEGANKLRLSASQVMRLAQGLYERGYITYMRTDSVSLSDTAIGAARDQARDLYGAEYVPAKPRRYTSKVRNAQEAHEAIRPAGERFRLPESLRGELSGDEWRLYDLIWKRTVASQMADATGVSVQARLAVTSSAGEDAVFAASGRTITFPGYLRAYVEGSADPAAELDDRERHLPPLAPGDVVAVSAYTAEGHATQPPARYTEATLVRRMEELGVGRPSTYASILQTIQDRGYVWRKGQALIPTWTAFAVVNLLERHFGTLVDYAFTARLEDDLDAIAARRAERGPWLAQFYFGNGSPGLRSMVSERLDEIDAADINATRIGEDADGVPIVAKPGRYGPYLKRGEDTAGIPEDLPPDELTVEKALELLEAPRSGDEPLGTDPTSGLPVFAKAGRFGPYVQLGDPEQLGGEKPRTSSLFPSMDLATITLEQALSLLTLPRTVGVDPDTGEEIVAANGRYGPYLKRGNDTRNLGTGNEEQLLTITMDEARAIFAQPRQFRGRGAPKPPLAELGPDPATGAPMVVKDGRFGPYVTDGTTNASLKRGDSIENLTPARAAELLADRREAVAAGGGTTKRSRSTGSSRSSTAKKAPAKKTSTSTAKKKTTTAKAGTTRSASAKTGTTKTGTKRASTAKRPAASSGGTDTPED